MIGLMELRGMNAREIVAGLRKKFSVNGQLCGHIVLNDDLLNLYIRHVECVVERPQVFLQ